MPELNWDGKAAALDVAKKIPVRLLEFDASLSCGDGSENLIVQGDNLEALKALLPFYRGRVRCAYLDPPYNTGAAFEHYNDNFPHADWLSMMFPRLELLKEFLSDDGSVWISIDDDEAHYLKVICDEIFDRKNFLIQMPRITKRSGKSTGVIAKNHDELLVYVKGERYKLNPFKHDDTGFKFRDEFFSERGFYKLNQTLDYDSLQYSGSLDYPLTVDGVTYYAGSSYENYLKRKAGQHKRADWAWRWSQEKFNFGLANGFIVVKKTRNGTRIYTKTYQRATIDGTGGKYFIKYTERTAPASSLALTANEFSNDNATKVLTSIFGEKIFDYSKPVSLIEFIFKMATDKDSIVLDAFAGSGTTAHAVINLNAQDGGNRKFILIEKEAHCRTITAERVRRVGGGFNFCQLGEKILDADGIFNPAVTFEQLAAFVWFDATKTPLVEKISSPLIGVHDGAAIYLLFGTENILTQETFPTLPAQVGKKIIYSAACRLDEEFLREHEIIFRHIPVDLKLGGSTDDVKNLSTTNA